MVFQVLLFSFICFLLKCQTPVLGEIWNLSKAEDLEFERQLKLLNKPAIKTIHADDGAIYDCVDFYKQPAFDHPMLKNHNYSFEIEAASDEAKDLNQDASDFDLDFGLNGEQCPRGTVIIKRLSKEDLIRAKIASNKRGSANGRIHYAGSRTKSSLRRYRGAGGSISIHKPYVDGKRYSAARVVIENGYFDRIAVGWRVDPLLHYDNKTHFYIRTDVGIPDGPTHCFNLECPGFVLTTDKYPVGVALPRISQKGGPYYTLQVDIIQNQNGDWKLRIGEDDKINFGFWPKNIFSESEGLREMASSVEWGGEVFSEPDFPRPPMGIGSFPMYDTLESSYISKVTYRNPYIQKIDAVNLEAYADLEEEYKVIDVQLIKTFRHIILYGGPGEQS